jgi:hypothetical protein
MATYPIMRGLTDAQDMHQKHPDTFDAPSAHELATIMPGDMIKVCQNHGQFSERVWVEVKGASGKYLIAQTEQGGIYRVEGRHAYSVWKKKDLPQAKA